ncbi:MAG: MBL fold metallo-hydrolase [Deltaproteobacteria bacterium]|nr:MBL fold metallo-hydrolase [Deltaproteobacteria bacterium]
MNPQNFVSKIKWLGHDSFRLDASKTVYFDPYEISSNPSADIILITHEHFDHCSPEDVAKIQTEQTVIVTEKDSAAKLSGDVRILAPGESLSIGDVTIEAVRAYNTDKDFHPKKNDWLGFIVEMDGIRIYHAGDTDHIPEMRDVKTDIALLPVSGTYVMTANEAVSAALDIEPKIAIPMHYGAIVGTGEDADIFKSELSGRIDVIVLRQESPG